MSDISVRKNRSAGRWQVAGLMLAILVLTTGCDTTEPTRRPKDGSLKWTFATWGSIFSSPAVASDGTVLVGSGDGTLYAIDPDGSERWLFETGGSISSSPVIISDGTVYIGSSDNNVNAINTHSGGPADSPWPMFRGNPQRNGRQHVP